MLFHTWGQSQVFLSMMYAGLFIGAWFEVLAFIGRVLMAGQFFTAVLDVIFGLGAAAILVLSLLMANYGEMRAFCLLGVVCGVILYFFTISPLLRLVIAKPCIFLGGQLKKLFTMPWANKVFR